MNYLIFSDTLARMEGTHPYSVINASTDFDPYVKRLKVLVVTRTLHWTLVGTGSIFAVEPSVLTSQVFSWVNPVVVGKWFDQDWDVMGPELGRLFYREWQRDQNPNLKRFQEGFKSRWGSL